MEVGVLYLPSVGSLEEKLKGFAGKRTDPVSHSFSMSFNEVRI